MIRVSANHFNIKYLSQEYRCVPFSAISLINMAADDCISLLTPRRFGNQPPVTDTRRMRRRVAVGYPATEGVDSRQS